MYGSEPGQSLRQLQDDLWNTGELLQHDELMQCSAAAAHT
jgi:hypothetical protein